MYSALRYLSLMNQYILSKVSQFFKFIIYFQDASATSNLSELKMDTIMLGSFFEPSTISLGFEKNFNEPM